MKTVNIFDLSKGSPIWKLRPIPWNRKKYFYITIHQLFILQTLSFGNFDMNIAVRDQVELQYL